MNSCCSVVVLGVALPPDSIEPPPGVRGGEHINSLLTATVLLRSMNYGLARWLERKGFKATMVPAEGSESGYRYADMKALKTGLSLRYAAYLANIG